MHTPPQSGRQLSRHNRGRSSAKSKSSKSSSRRSKKSRKPDHKFYVNLKIISSPEYVTTIIEKHVEIGAWEPACSRITSEQVWNRKVQNHCDFEALSVLEVKKTVEQLLIEEGLVKRFLVRIAERETLCENVADMDMIKLWKLATSDYCSPLIYKFVSETNADTLPSPIKLSMRRSLTMDEMQAMADTFDSQATSLLTEQIQQLVEANKKNTLMQLMGTDVDQTIWEIANTIVQPENHSKLRLEKPMYKELLAAIAQFRDAEGDMSTQIKGLSAPDILSFFGEHAEFLQWQIKFAREVVAYGKAMDLESDEYRYFFGTQSVDPDKSEELKLPRLCYLLTERVGSYLTVLSGLVGWTDYTPKDVSMMFRPRPPALKAQRSGPGPPMPKNLHEVWGVIVDFGYARGPEVREPLGTEPNANQLQAGDIITQINGEPAPKNVEDFLTKITTGEQTKLRVLRNPTEVLIYAMQQLMDELLTCNVALKKSLGMTQIYGQLNQFRVSLKRKLVQQCEVGDDVLCSYNERRVSVSRVMLFSDMFCITVHGKSGASGMGDLALIEEETSNPRLPEPLGPLACATPARSGSSDADRVTHMSFESHTVSRSRSRLDSDFRNTRSTSRSFAADTPQDELAAVMLLPIYKVLIESHPDDPDRVLIKLVNKVNLSPGKRHSKRAVSVAKAMSPTLMNVKSVNTLTLDLTRDGKLFNWIRQQRKSLSNQPSTTDLFEKWSELSNSMDRSRREAWFDSIIGLYPNGKNFLEQSHARRGLPNKNHFTFLRTLFCNTKYSSEDESNIRKLHDKIQYASGLRTGDTELETELTAELATAKLLPPQRRRMRIVTFKCELPAEQARQNTKILNTLCYRYPVITSQRPALKKYNASDDYFVLPRVEPVLGYQPITFEEMKSSLCERFAVVGPVTFHSGSRMAKFKNISVVHVWGTNFEDNKTKDYQDIFVQANADDAVFAQLYVDEIVKTFTLAFEAAKIMGATTIRVPAIGLGENTLQALPTKLRTVICDKFFAALIAVSTRYSGIKLDKRFPYNKHRPETNLFQEIAKDDVCIISPCEAWSFIGNGGSSFMTVDSRIATGSYSRELREACGNNSAYLHNVFFCPEIMNTKTHWSYVNALVYDVAKQKGSTSQWAVLCKFSRQDLTHELHKEANEAKSAFLSKRRMPHYKYSALYEVQLNGMIVRTLGHGLSGLNVKGRQNRMDVYCQETVAGAVIAASLHSQNIRDKGKPLMWGVMTRSQNPQPLARYDVPAVNVHAIRGLLVLDLFQLAVAPLRVKSIWTKMNSPDKVSALLLEECFGEGYEQDTMKPLQKMIQRLWLDAQVATVFSLCDPSISRTMLLNLLQRLGVVGRSSPLPNSAVHKYDAVYAVCCSSSSSNVLVESLKVLGVSSLRARHGFKLLAVQSFEERAAPDTMAQLMEMGVTIKHMWRLPSGMNAALRARINNHFGLSNVDPMLDPTMAHLNDDQYNNQL